MRHTGLPLLGGPGADRTSLTQVVPTRRTYGWVAALLMVFTVYLSVLPFRLELVPLADALPHFLDAMTTWPRRLPRANFLANLLLFVPIGFTLAGARLADRPDRSWLVASMRAITFSLCASVTAEFAQLYAPRRVVSAADVVAQTVGCVVGLVAWLGVGRPLTAWLRESQTHHHDRLDRVLMGYMALWVFANLAPFDVTLDVDELARRVRSGLIAVFPTVPRRTVREWWDLTVTFASCLPLGVAMLAAGVRHPSGRRSWGGALALACGLLLAVEGAQVFIRSHAATALDLGVGVLGATVGVWAGTRWRPVSRASSAVTGWWPFAALGASLVLAASYHWQPFDFVLDEEDVRRKLASISLIPFAGYGAGSDLAALNNVISKVGVALPVGVFAGLAMPRSVSRLVALAVWVPLAVAVFGAVEVGQFFLPSRVPDVTDVAMGVAASVVGLALGRGLGGSRSSHAGRSSR